MQKENLATRTKSATDSMSGPVKMTTVTVKTSEPELCEPFTRKRTKARQINFVV